MGFLVPAVTLAAMVVAAGLSLIGYHFARLPGWRDQRWFWVWAAAASVYNACNVLITQPLPDQVRLATVSAGWIALAVHVMAWNAHAAAHLHAPITRWERAALALVVASCALALAPGALFERRIVSHHVGWLSTTYHDAPPTRLGQAAVVVLYGCFLFPFWRYLKAARASPDARRYALGMLGLLLAGANDALVSTGGYELPYLLDFAFLILALLVGKVLVDRFIGGALRLDQLSGELERLVAQRTAELEKAHEALLQAERMAAIGRLSAGVAHEINNPAAAVVSNLTYLHDGLKQGALPEDAPAALRDSLTSMEKIARIVRQLLDTGRVAGADTSVRSTFDVLQAVQHAVQTVRRAVGPAPRITVRVPQLFARGDQLLVEQVLVNLIVNAAQAVPDGRVPEIDVSAEALTQQVRLSVRDNGSGMTEDVVRRAFDPFFSTKPIGSGTGLGLSVSLGLAKSVGGDLRVASTSPRGTTMELLLRSGTRGSLAPPAPGPETAPTKRRLLLVDDDPIVRESLSRMLSRAFEIRTAAGVPAAQRLLDSDSFDAVLCDVMMNDGGGEAFYNWLRERDAALAGRVIFVTGGVTNDAARRFFDEQEQPVLYKPVDLAAVTRAVDEVTAVRELEGPGGPDS